MAALQAALASLAGLKLPQVVQPTSEQATAAAAFAAAASAKASAQAERTAEMELDAEAQHSGEKHELEHAEDCVFGKVCAW